MVWFYVVVGLLVIIAILMFMKTDSRLKGRLTKRTELITDVTYVCMHCGNSFKGSRCPKCGSERKPLEFGR
jgi:rubrerythrin